jgi:type IV secretion system protein VirB3
MPGETIGGLMLDPLFVGATRPPMRWGVTYSALLFNMVFTLEAFLLTKNLLALLLCLPIHGVCMLLCARDARYFDLILLWARTRLPALLANYRVWRASSYSPLQLDLPNARGHRRGSACDVHVLTQHRTDAAWEGARSCRH